MTTLDDQLRSSDPMDVYSALIRIGKGELFEYKEHVAPFVRHADPDLRRGAIQVLAFFWRLPEYEAVARTMAMSDPDDLVQGTALTAWSSFHTGTRAADVIATLLDVVLDPRRGPSVRDSAYRAILRVGDVMTPERLRAKGEYPDVERGFDWKLLADVAEQVGVAVPDALRARVVEP